MLIFVACFSTLQEKPSNVYSLAIAQLPQSSSHWLSKGASSVQKHKHVLHSWDHCYLQVCSILLMFCEHTYLYFPLSYYNTIFFRNHSCTAFNNDKDSNQQRKFYLESKIILDLDLIFKDRILSPELYDNAAIQLSSFEIVHNLFLKGVEEQQACPLCQCSTATWHTLYKPFPKFLFFSGTSSRMESVSFPIFLNIDNKYVSFSYQFCLCTHLI